MGHIISNKGIYMDPENIESMMSWHTPRKLTDVISFVGLAGYCRRFIEGYYVGKVEYMYGLRRLACGLVDPGRDDPHVCVQSYHNFLKTIGRMN